MPPENGVLRVGDGRGFLIEYERQLVGPAGATVTVTDRLILTAAHCLPKLPPPHPASYTEERTYGNLLGLLGEESGVWAECLFADPVADVAVLGSPDGQALYEEAEAYDALTEAMMPLQVVDRPDATVVQLLSLDGHWFGCTVKPRPRGLWITDAPERILGGMSGSPVLTEENQVLGVVSTGVGLNPRLAVDLPGWLLRGSLHA